MWSKASAKEWNDELEGYDAFVEGMSLYVGSLSVGIPRTVFLIDCHYPEFGTPDRWCLPTPDGVKKLLSNYPEYKKQQLERLQSLIERVNKEGANEQPKN